MGSLFKTPSMKSAIPRAETPAIPQTESAEDIVKNMKKQSGRRDTIVSGALEPTDIGKRSLLG